MSEQHPKESDTGWFDKKSNVQKILVFLYVFSGLIVVIDIALRVIGFDKHPYFKWEQWPGFYAVYGFVACVVLILISKYILRPLVMRSENFYDDSKGGDDA